MKRVALVALAVATCALAGPLRADEGALATGRFSIEGYAPDASRTSGTLVVTSVEEGLRVERSWERLPGGVKETLTGRARSLSGALEIEWDRTQGVMGALGEARSKEGERTTYRPDGHGGLVGRFVHGGAAHDETLSPLLDAGTLAAIGSGTALERARRAEHLGTRELRGFVDALAASGDLYAALRHASDEDRLELARLARKVERPDPAARENEAAEAALAKLAQEAKSTTPRWDVIVVPGFTPKRADRLHEIDAVAARRCRRAAEDWKAGKAPFVLTSGGAVHPDGTPVVEALELKAELVRLGVPAERIFVETRARHSTTNLRNAGRFMLAHRMKRALVVSGFAQTFYFASPDLSSFHLRCREELGYEVGSFRPVDPNRTTFRPSERVKERNEGDAYDP